jgi:hypothetical protein
MHVGIPLGASRMSLALSDWTHLLELLVQFLNRVHHHLQVHDVADPRYGKMNIKSNH